MQGDALIFLTILYSDLLRQERDHRYKSNIIHHKCKLFQTSRVFLPHRQSEKLKPVLTVSVLIN